MPVKQDSTFKPPFYLTNNHLQTIYPALLRKVEGVHYQRERVELPDGDFVDIDWSKVGSEQLMIAIHGLEGNADRAYIRGMVKQFNQQGWDALAWNFRGCSGEPNRLLRSYHSGDTADLDFVIRRIQQQKKYRSIVLVGYSLGGNVTLKYVGAMGDKLPSIIRAAVAFSVPCHLASSSLELSKWYNKVYMSKFLRDLKAKIAFKKPLSKPGEIDWEAVEASKNFAEFDGAYTAPAHGFASANDYWDQSSSKQWLTKIQIPTLLVNAKDDSFLSEACFPIEEAKQNPNFHLEIPKQGGHVGFVPAKHSEIYWSEKRAWAFVEDQCA